MEQSKKRQDMIKVAKFYYYGNMSQDEIAQLMQISRPKVSRLLSEARQLNIVQVTIHDPCTSLKQNEDKIKAHFGLEYVKIVPTQCNEQATKAAIGQAATVFLNEHIQEDSIIGISWGTTMAAFVNEFKTKRPVPKATIVQLIGGTYSETLNIDVRELVKDLANKLECQHSILQAPLVVHNPKLRDMLLEEPMTREHFRKIRNLDIAFVGIGSAYYKESIVYRANYIEETAAKTLSEMGLVCDICGHQLLSDGSAPHTFLSERVIAIALEDLHRVPLVVGLCAGKVKTAPLMAALHGHHVNCIIIDEVAALALITEEKL